MGKYTGLVTEIIKNVGGKDNVNSLTHCVTRLRFKLKDESVCQDDVLKGMDGVVTVLRSGGQYQVVIGNHVPEVYKEACAQLGLGAGTPAAPAEETANKGVGAGLVYPTLQGVDINLFGWVVNASYTSTLLPVVFTVIFASFIYKPLDKVCPAVVKTFLVPMITMAIAMPIGFVVIAPIMNTVSNALGGFIGGAMAPTTILTHVFVSLVLGMAFTFVSCWMLYKGEEKK